ncbi:phosphatase PAP2 family protein [Halorussus salilacus]|uniref:phosphatase PAP2 family protein n=1 Tax=Halorussus salilacus TaxID=2953750 RepID=UPI0020A15F34|nr:phosphatase PAP2 family protein [Halorussus salilacus]USZ67099.1 phosphatase PAP2 family protein [Halorussus salilacus]
MSDRSLGVVETLAETLPPVVREAFTVVTQLGDAWFLIVVAALLYWFGDRERGAFAVATVLGALALTVTLKGAFALPRPPAELHVAYTDSYGFPSGHAIASTTLWGLLALVVERGTRTQRGAVAALAILAVTSARVIIGVHYVVDVLAGIAVGLTYLGVLVRATRWDPTRAFAVVAGISLAGLATAGFTADSVASVAGVGGAAATWLALDAPPRGRVSAASALAALAALGAVGYAGNELALPLVGVFGLNLVVPAGILLVPLVVERARKTRSASPT